MVFAIPFTQWRNGPVRNFVALTPVYRTESLTAQSDSTSASLPSSLLILPPEIREIIYQFYFLSYKENGATCPVGVDRRKLAYNHVHSFSGLHIAYPPLLHTSTILRREAAKAFFTTMTFEMRFPLSPHRVCCTNYWTRCEQCQSFPYVVLSSTNQHDQCCSFPNYEDRVRGMLLSEPLSPSTTSLIHSVSLDAEALCPKVFSILSRCCPALKSLVLDVGRNDSRATSQIDIPKRFNYHYSLLYLGLVHLPGLTYLGLHLAMWRYQSAEEQPSIQNAYLALQRFCECLREQYSGVSARGLVDLFCEVIPIFDEPYAIHVSGTTKFCRRLRKNQRNPQTVIDHFDDTPDSEWWP